MAALGQRRAEREERQGEETRQHARGKIADAARKTLQGHVEPVYHFEDRRGGDQLVTPEHADGGKGEGGRRGRLAGEIISVALGLAGEQSVPLAGRDGADRGEVTRLHHSAASGWTSMRRLAAPRFRACAAAARKATDRSMTRWRCLSSVTI